MKKGVWKGTPLFERVIWARTRVKGHPGGARGFAHPEPIGVTPLYDVIYIKTVKTKECQNLFLTMTKILGTSDFSPSLQRKFFYNE